MCIFYSLVFLPWRQCHWAARRSSVRASSSSSSRAHGDTAPSTSQSWNDNTCHLTLSQPNKLLSVKFLICSIFQSPSIVLKVGENVAWVTNSSDPDETPSYSVSHPDPSILFAYGTTVVLGGLRVNAVWKNSEFHVLVQRNFGDTIFTSCPIKLKFTSIIGRF